MCYLKYFTGDIFILLETFLFYWKHFYFTGSIVIIPEKESFGYWKKKCHFNILKRKYIFYQNVFLSFYCNIVCENV